MLRRARRRVCTLIGAALILIVPPAAAAPTPGDRVLAESLLQEGRDLMNGGKIAEACAKLSESYQLDAVLGTLLDLATCHEKEGKLASAFSELKEAATLARATHQDDQEATAIKRAEALQGQIAFLVLVVPPSSPPGLEVRIDGTIVGSAIWGQKRAIDSGTHRIEARAPQKQPWTRELVVAPGTNELTVEVPALADASAPPSPPPPSTDVTPPASSSSLSTIGWLTAGVGAAGIVVGSVFGVRTLSLKSDRDEHCGPGNLCDREGVALDDDARSAATVSTVAFASGLVLVAAGVALILVSPSRSSQARIVDLRASSIGARW